MTKTLTLDKFLGVTLKESSKLDTGLHTTIHNLDVRGLNLVKVRGTQSATLNGVPFEQLGLTGVDKAHKFVTGQPSTPTVYLCQDGQKIMRWDSSTASWSQIDSALSNTLDVVNFITRNGVCIIATGAAAANLPEWYGYVPARWSYAYTNTGVSVESLPGGFYCDDANTDAPISTVLEAATNFTSAAWTAGIDGDTVGIRYYKVSFQYDNAIWTKPSKVVLGYTTAAQKNRIRLDIKLDPTTTNSRVTGIRVYASNDAVTYYCLREISINANYQVVFDGTSILDPADIINILGSVSGTYNGTTGEFTPTASFTWPADLLNGLVLLTEVTGYFDTFTGAYFISDTTADTVIIPTGLTLAGTVACALVSAWRWDGSYYCYSFIDYETDLTAYSTMADLGIGEDEDVSANYEIATIGGNRQYIARVYKGGEVYTNRVYFSYVDSNGISCYDMFRDADFVSTGAIGINNILALRFNANQVFIFGEEGVAVLDVSATSVFGWRLSRLTPAAGLIAPQSVVELPDGRYVGGYGYLAPDGAKVLYGGFCYNVSEDLVGTPTTNPFGATTPSEAVSVFNAEGREWLLAFPTDQKVWKYSVLLDAWTSQLLTIEQGLTDDNTLAMVSGDSIVVFGGNSLFTPELLSAWVEFPADTLLKRVGVCYVSSTPVQLSLYKDGSGTAYASLELAAVSSLDVAVYVNAPYGNWGRRFRIGITLSAADAAVNTAFELSRVYVEVTERRPV